jgi:hypothetical protein
VCLVLAAGLLSGSAAVAQLPIQAPAPVTAGSIIPFNHGATGLWSQVYSMKIAPNGNILFLDSAVSQIYQLAPGASTPTLVVGPAPSNGHSDCSVLEPSGSYWNAAIAFDAQNNLYVTDRYGSSVQFCRVPYDSTSKTWKFQTADNWVGPTYTNSSGVSSPIPPQDLQVGDDGTFYVTTSDTQSIFKFTVDSTGKVTSVTPMITGMQDMTSNIAVDHAGNLFFIENAYDAPSNRVTGIREIPANATLPIVGDGTGKAESQLLRIDPGGEGFNGIKGISFDAHGNLYFSSENNSSYGGLVDGIFMIPNGAEPCMGRYGADISGGLRISGACGPARAALDSDRRQLKLGPSRLVCSGLRQHEYQDGGCYMPGVEHRAVETRHAEHGFFAGRHSRRDTDAVLYVQ